MGYLRLFGSTPSSKRRVERVDCEQRDCSDYGGCDRVMYGSTGFRPASTTLHSANWVSKKRRRWSKEDQKLDREYGGEYLGGASG
jgi:hypothetical protein